MLQVVFLLSGYFLLVTAVVALAVLPSVRAATLSGCRRGAARITRWSRQTAGTTHRRFAVHAYNVMDAIHREKKLSLVCSRRLLLAIGLMAVFPLGALAWRHWYTLETFDHTDAYAQNERVAALLTGERLSPPVPPPPDVFMTKEVAQARPSVRSANRDWMLLDEEFRQRVLMVYRIMREEHGYEMVLLEGYRSPERQAQIVSAGSHVTQAAPGRSYHQHGLAIDSAFLRDGRVVISERDEWAMRGYQLYGQTAALFGLTWGGAWKSLADYGHVEWQRPGTVRPWKTPAGTSAN